MKPVIVTSELAYKEAIQFKESMILLSAFLVFLFSIILPFIISSAIVTNDISLYIAASLIFLVDLLAIVLLIAAILVKYEKVSGR